MLVKLPRIVTVFFSFCALAYLVAWGIMKVLIPVRTQPPLPAELANAR